MRGPNGRLLQLEAGAYRAGIASVGAGLQSLTYSGSDIVLPFDMAEIPPAYAGKTLAPWPNRVAGGAYRFDGAEHQLPVNEATTGSALHGLALWNDWTVLAAGDSTVVLGHTLHGQPGYPFQLELGATFDLQADTGLTYSLTARNVGRSAAPYGASSHPFLTAGPGSIDAFTLQFTPASILLVDEKAAPVSLEPVAGTRWDYATARVIGSDTIDHAFTGFPAGPWEVTLRNPGSRLSTTLRSTTDRAPWVQVYSGELRGRLGLAVEPMSCPPNAFNSLQDLVVLQPGEQHLLRYSLSASFRA